MVFMKIILQSKFLFACLYAAGVEKHVAKVRDNNEGNPTRRYSECDFVTKRWSPQCRGKNIVGFIKGLFNLKEEEEEEEEKKKKKTEEEEEEEKKKKEEEEEKKKNKKE